MGNELTAIAEQDGAVSIKDAEGNTVRYVKETDLLAVKGSKESLESQAKAAEAAREVAVREANEKVEAERQKTLQAEAKVTSLEEQVKTGGASAEELATAKQALVTAQEAEKGSATKLLELKRTTMIGTYGVPKETVESKTLAELETFEEALKAVIGQKNAGNYAIGGTGGGANPLIGIHPTELARQAYEQGAK